MDLFTLITVAMVVIVLVVSVIGIVTSDRARRRNLAKMHEAVDSLQESIRAMQEIVDRRDERL